MLSFLSSLLAKVSGGGAPAAPPAFDAIEYKGYRVRPAPYPARGGFQTAGVIEREIGGETKQHCFVRADTLPSADEAAALALSKARQIIEEQGDGIFKEA
jgi:hypothetical protein